MACVDLSTNPPPRPYRPAPVGWNGVPAAGRHGYVSVGGVAGLPPSAERAAGAAAPPSPYLLAAGGADANTTRWSEARATRSPPEGRFGDVPRDVTRHAPRGVGGLQPPEGPWGHAVLEPCELVGGGHSPPVNPDRVALGLGLDAAGAGVALPHPLTKPPWQAQPFHLPSDASSSGRGDDVRDGTPWARHFDAAEAAQPPGISRHDLRGDHPAPCPPGVDTPGLRTLSAILSHGNSLVLDRTRCLADSIADSQERLHHLLAATGPSLTTDRPGALSPRRLPPPPTQAPSGVWSTAPSDPSRQ